MCSHLADLKNRLAEVNDIESAGALLNWDQCTLMPPGGATARGRQLSTLTRIAHDKFTDPAIGRLLEQLSGYEQTLPYDHDDAALLRVTRREYERQIKVPGKLVAELSAHQSSTYELWTKARPANDFKSLQGPLEKTLDLSRQLANCFPGYEHIADPLIDTADYGMKASSIRELFSKLREQLVPLVQKITAQPVAGDECLRQHFPEAEQLAFGEKIIRAFGYDFNRGRQDKSHHPFMTKFSLGDVRITTRVQENEFGDALFSTMHEAGHAIYEQGIRLELEATPLAGGTSSGVHESQSRLWENMVGRSRGFWQHFYPQLQAAFPTQFGKLPLDHFHRAINKVERTLIRTDSDELTYNLHVMIRFDLELQMLEGKLAIRDLPEAWHSRYQNDIGIRAPDDRDGCLQDVHWFGGIIGGVFQGYTLGNILGAQFYEAALRAKPCIPSEIETGRFEMLRGWLRDNIYQHGAKFTADEIVQRATGSPMSIDPYLRYLKAKYGDLYQIN